MFTAGDPAADAPPAEQAFTAEPPAGDPSDGGGPVTDKGLPKRTPRTVAAPRTEDARPQPPRRVDAEELRRRLGGFYQGAQDGRRVVAAELAQDREPDRGQEKSKTDQGDSAQEART